MSRYAFRFILSAEAGKGLPPDLAERIARAFAGRELPDIRMTGHAGHVAELAREWAERFGEEGIVYACGGDGTLHEAAEEIVGSGCAFGALPFGTGNDFCKTLYGTRKVEALVDELIKGSPNPSFRKIDVLTVNETICLNVLSLGFDTVVLEKTLQLLHRRPSLGKMAYVLGVIRALSGKKEFPLRYCLTDAKGERQMGEMSAILLAAGNGRFYGSGYQPLPEALLDDGRGDFLAVRTMSAFELISLIQKYRKGEHLGLEKVFHTQFSGAVIESTDGAELPANVDGILFHSRKIELGVLPSALRLAFPG